jgi:hypothetical protein
VVAGRAVSLQVGAAVHVRAAAAPRGGRPGADRAFFITARLATQDTREAFTEVLLETLASLLGQSLPPVLPEATRAAYLPDLMSQAAARCKDADGRLVLVVDGLDEDRGSRPGRMRTASPGCCPSIRQPGCG